MELESTSLATLNIPLIHPTPLSDFQGHWEQGWAPRKNVPPSGHWPTLPLLWLHSCGSHPAPIPVNHGGAQAQAKLGWAGLIVLPSCAPPGMPIHFLCLPYSSCGNTSSSQLELLWNWQTVSQAGAQLSQVRVCVLQLSFSLGLSPWCLTHEHSHFQNTYLPHSSLWYMFPPL